MACHSTRARPEWSLMGALRPRTGCALPRETLVENIGKPEQLFSLQVCELLAIQSCAVFVLDQPQRS